MTEESPISLIVSTAAFILSLFSFFWVYLRGPKISCDKIRYILLGNTIENAIIGLWLTFSNVGSSTGVIESIFILLRDPLNDQITPFIAYSKDFDEDDPKVGSPFEKPVPPVALSPNSSIDMKILFVNEENNDFKFSAKEYFLNVYLMESGKEKANLCVNRHIKLSEEMEIDKPKVTIDPTGTEKILEIPLNPRLKWWELI
jgi:hypothetical protein